MKRAMSRKWTRSIYQGSSRVPGAPSVRSVTTCLSRRIRVSGYCFIYHIFFRSEYAGSEEQARKITILDANWSDYVMRVESATVNSFGCRLTFNTETKETDLFEVESVANAV